MEVRTEEIVGAKLFDSVYWTHESLDKILGTEVAVSSAHNYYIVRQITSYSDSCIVAYLYP